MKKLTILIIVLALFTLAARGGKPLPGTVTVTPDPVAAGVAFTITGADIPDDGSGGVWLAIAGDAETCTAGTTWTGDLLDGDEFTTTWTLYAACTYTVTVYEGFGGTKAKILATTSFTVQ